MAGYFLYHSIGTFADKQAKLTATLSEFATKWSATDDAQWGYALTQQAAFLSKWAELIGADAAHMAQAESVTGGLYSILRGLDPKRIQGGTVLIAKDCFPSLHFLLAETVTRMGGTLKTVEPAANEAFVSDAQMLAAWDNTVRLAVLTWVTSTSSHKSDIKALTEHGHKMGSLVGIDVTQGIGIRPYDVTDIGADFTVGSSLKWLCGVSGSAVIHATPELIENCQPEFRGWFSQGNPFSWDLDAFEFAPDARRFGNGTPNVLPAISCLSGLDFVLSTGVSELAKDNAQKTAFLFDWIDALDLHLVSPKLADQRGGSLMISLPETIDPTHVVDTLRGENLFADARGQVLRLSPGNVTKMEDCKHVISVLGKLLNM